MLKSGHHHTNVPDLPTIAIELYNLPADFVIAFAEATSECICRFPWRLSLSGVSTRVNTDGKDDEWSWEPKVSGGEATVDASSANEEELGWFCFQQWLMPSS